MRHNLPESWLRSIDIDVANSRCSPVERKSHHHEYDNIWVGTVPLPRYSTRLSDTIKLREMFPHDVISVYWGHDYGVAQHFLLVGGKYTLIRAISAPTVEIAWSLMYALKCPAPKEETMRVAARCKIWKEKDHIKTDRGLDGHK